MTWLRQAAHVAAKDARMAWYLFAALVPLVLLQALQFGGSLAPLWSVLLPLMTLVLVAFVVQADPAVRSEAFWVTLPLERGAVFAGKLLSALAVLLLVLVGEAILLARHAEPAAGALRLLLATASSEGWLLAVAILIAALTRDLRTFLLALVVGFVAMIVAAVGGAVSMLGRHPAGPPPWIWPIVAIVGSLALAGYQYGTGRRLRAGIAAVLFLGAVLLLSAAFQPNVFAGPRFGRPLPPGLRPDTVLAVRVVPLPGGPTDGTIQVRLVGGSPTLDYELDAASVQVRRPDGSLRNLALFSPEPLTPPLAAAPELPGARWAYRSRPTAFWTPLNPIGRRLASQGETLLRLDGEISAAQPSVMARLPLRAGAALAQAGRRIHIEAAAVSAGAVSVDLEVSRIDSDEEPFLRGDRMRYALLDRAQRLIYPLAQSSASSSAGGFVGGGARRSSVQLQLGAPMMPPSSLPAGPGPFELLVIDWHIVGSYHVNLPVESRTRGAGAPADGPPVPAGVSAAPLPLPAR